MRHKFHCRFLYAVALSLCALLFSGCATQSRDSVVPEILPLQAKNSHPLEGIPPACGCWLYAYDSKLSDDEVLLSISSVDETTTVCRLKVDGLVVDLKQNARKKNGDETQMSFGAGKRKINLWLKEVEFKSECSQHIDPPLHGSCFRGKMNIQIGAQNSSMAVKMLCGC